MTEMLNAEMLLADRTAERAIGEIPELDVMAAAASRFAEKFGAGAEIIDGLTELQGSPRPDHTPSACMWYMMGTDAEGLKCHNWYSRKKDDGEGDGDGDGGTEES